jgi:hypothetical protein
MTPADLAPAIEEYRAGLEAELQLLHQLERISQEQEAVSRDGDLSEFDAAADERDRLMQSLVAIEAGLRGVRQMLTDHRGQASAAPGFGDVVRLHREAARLVGAILTVDQQSLSALADAELARRSAVVALERGETTLAAYRRVLAPPLASATLLNRRG